MLDFIKEFFSWYNFIYTLPLILVFFYTLLHFLGFAFHTGGHDFWSDISDIGVDADDDIGDVNVDADESIFSDFVLYPF
jgi:hypothetical protein